MAKQVKRPVKKPAPHKAKKPVKTCKPCKPCKPCAEQHIYHHHHHHRWRGEDIGNFGWSDLKRVGGSIKKAVLGNATTKIETIPKSQPPSSQVFLKKKRRTDSIQPPGYQYSEPEYIEVPKNRGNSPQTPLNYRTMVEPPSPPQPQPPQQPSPPRPPTITDEWKNAVLGAGQSIKTRATQAVTPQGAYNIAKTTGRGAVRAAKYGVDTAYKGMVWLDKERLAALQEKEDRRKEQMDRWWDIPYEKRLQILEERALRDQQRQKLREARQQGLEYQLDRADAYLTGQKFTPRVFKVKSSGAFGETYDTYMDQYGREVPGIPEEEVTRKRKKRSEAQEIGNIFGFTSGGGPIRSPLYEPPAPRQLMGADEGYVEMPRRRVRYSAEPPQYSEPAPRRIGSGVSPRREAEDFRKLLM